MLEFDSTDAAIVTARQRGDKIGLLAAIENKLELLVRFSLSFTLLVWQCLLNARS